MAPRSGCLGLDLLRYRVRIWEQWLNAGNSGRLPVVVPVVVYHGAASWCVSRQFADEVEDAPALRDYVPACVDHLIDLSGYRDDELQGAVMLHTALLTLKYIFQGYGDSILNCKLGPITRRRTHPSSATFATTTRGVIDHSPPLARRTGVA
jgi:hypothetical protein